MNRILYLAGFTFIGLCAALIVRAGRSPAVSPVSARATPVGAYGGSMSGDAWFASMRPYCNPVEVEVRSRYTPPPTTTTGRGYAAACFGLAGKIDRARTIIDSMPASERGAAANVVFDVAHPVADAGDDRASGPMMELVLEFWPNNYMALYHAGMSEYAMGRTALAESHLRAFLGLYTAADGFTANARTVLERLESSAPRRMLRVRKRAERELPTP